ncbi:MAG: sigma-70 family RNA polymerase sigma factor [Myxococcales bacterium]
MSPARKFAPVPESRPPTLRALPFEGSDEALVHALRLGHPGAKAVLYDRHRVPVRRVLARVLGIDQELPDLLQEVFVQALARIHELERPDRLGAWLVGIAVFTARGQIRRRRRQRWLSFWSPEVIAELPAGEASDDEAKQLLRATYRVLARLPEEERIVFALRFLEGMELREVAEASGLSLATVKRRLARAGTRFESLAQRDPELASRLARGAEWP